MNNTAPVIIRQLGRQAYLPIWQAMQDFTDSRDNSSQDEIWLVEHDPVFTQGQAGKEEHLLAPGDIPVVYVDGKKVCSIGLRIRRGCSFHGLALNVNMDLAPFQRINPCGYAGLEMVDCTQLGGPDSLAVAGPAIAEKLCSLLGIASVENKEGFDE